MYRLRRIHLTRAENHRAKINVDGSSAEEFHADDKKRPTPTPPIKSEKPDDQNRTCLYEFHPTPTMSTYLVAFAIGAYDYVETRDRNGVLIRVYTPVGKTKRRLFALHVR